jgi:hypothetical protein
MGGSFFFYVEKGWEGGFFFYKFIRGGLALVSFGRKINKFQLWVGKILERWGQIIKISGHHPK